MDCDPLFPPVSFYIMRWCWKVNFLGLMEPRDRRVLIKIKGTESNPDLVLWPHLRAAALKSLVNWITLFVTLSILIATGLWHSNTLDNCFCSWQVHTDLSSFSSKPPRLPSSQQMGVVKAAETWFKISPWMNPLLKGRWVLPHFAWMGSSTQSELFCRLTAVIATKKTQMSFLRLCLTLILEYCRKDLSLVWVSSSLQSGICSRAPGSWASINII